MFTQTGVMTTVLFKEAAAKYNKALEINSHPDRLDINEKITRQVSNLGIKLAINSDAHHKSDLSIINYGILNARKGWVEKEDVLNAIGLED